MTSFRLKESKRLQKDLPNDKVSAGSHSSALTPHVIIDSPVSDKTRTLSCFNKHFSTVQVLGYYVR